MASVTPSRSHMPEAVRPGRDVAPKLASTFCKDSASPPWRSNRFNTVAPLCF